MKKHNVQIPREKSRDTGMALVLLLLVAYLFRKDELFVVSATVIHVINMTLPDIYRPVATIWFGLSRVVGTAVSMIVLVIVFFFVVTPIGMLRRATGRDSLRLRMFGASDESVFIKRNHLFKPKDLEKPY